jgi:hypothetical protein
MILKFNFNGNPAMSHRRRNTTNCIIFYVIIGEAGVGLFRDWAMAESGLDASSEFTDGSKSSNPVKK